MIFSEGENTDESIGLNFLFRCKLIEINRRVHGFFFGDRLHPQPENIYVVLKTLAGYIQEAGLAPNTDFVLHDVDEGVKEHMLGSHMEKLAIAFGLINTRLGTAIKITKILFVCGATTMQPS